MSNAVPARWMSDGTLWRCTDVEKDVWEIAVWVDGNMGHAEPDWIVKRDEVEETAGQEAFGGR